MTLRSAYLSTTYRAFIVNQDQLDLIVGQSNHALDQLLSTGGLDSYAFITAWNPFSKTVSDEENHTANKALKSELGQYRIYEGIGIPKQPSKWEGEQSFLILGINREEATRLGTKYQQNAIIYGEVGSEPELLMLVQEK